MKCDRGYIVFVTVFKKNDKKRNEMNITLLFFRLLRYSIDLTIYLISNSSTKKEKPKNKKKKEIQLNI